MKLLLFLVSLYTFAGPIFGAEREGHGGNDYWVSEFESSLERVMTAMEHHSEILPNTFKLTDLEAKISKAQIEFRAFTPEKELVINYDLPSRRFILFANQWARLKDFYVADLAVCRCLLKLEGTIDSKFELCQQILDEGSILQNL